MWGEFWESEFLTSAVGYSNDQASLKTLVKYDLKIVLIIQAPIKCLTHSVQMFIDWLIISTAELKVDSQ